MPTRQLPTRTHVPSSIKRCTFMRKASTIQILFAFLFMCAGFVLAGAQNRERFVISAKAGGINAVSGRTGVQPQGGTGWEQLTIKDNLEAGDLVKTGIDGRVEMLLNPGAYLRVGENSEFELTNNSLDNLEVRLIKGTAIVEATGTDNTELMINITTPHTRMSIVRRGLYRVNVMPGDATELIVRKGRVMLEGSHTKVKGGNKVVFSSGSFSVAKLQKEDKKDADSFAAWSKDRAETLAKANSKISGRALTAFTDSFRHDWSFSGFSGRSGFWLFNAAYGCYTFLPFGYGVGSPYGGSYSRFFFGGYPGFGQGYFFGRGPLYGSPGGTGGTSGGTSGGYSGTSGSGRSGGSTINPPIQPPRNPDPPVSRGRGKFDPAP